MVCLIFYFYDPFFTPALKDEKGVPEAYHGLIFSVCFVFFLGSCLVVGEIVSLLPKRVFMALSYTICILALLLLGPSRILGLPNSVYILIGGQALLGIGMGFVFIPIMPEMIDALYAAKGIQEGEDERVDSIVADKAAGLYGLFYSTGMMIAPILGSFIFEHFE
jgi:MFS family permease